MTTTAIDLQKIKEILPVRYCRLLQRRLIDRQGKHFSTTYISQVLSNPVPNMNSAIVKEAILWAEEIVAENEEYTRKLEALKQ